MFPKYSTSVPKWLKLKISELFTNAVVLSCYFFSGNQLYIRWSMTRCHPGKHKSWVCLCLSILSSIRQQLSYQRQKSPFVDVDQLDAECCRWIFGFYHYTCCKLSALCNLPSVNIATYWDNPNQNRDPAFFFSHHISASSQWTPAPCQLFSVRKKTPL